MAVNGGRVHLVDYDSDSEEEVREDLEREYLPNPLRTPVLSVERDHGGRVRSVEHVSGNWASFLYAEGSVLISSLVKELSNPSNLTKFESFHLSLSKLLILRYVDIDPLRQKLKYFISQYSRSVLKISLVDPDSLFLTSNEEKTRTFVALKVTSPKGFLDNVVEGLNDVLDDFDLPSFYDPPLFHISLFWCLGNETDEMKSNVLPQIREEILKKTQESVIEIPLNELFLKCGHKIFRLPFSDY